MESKYGVEAPGAWACLMGTRYHCLRECSGCSRAALLFALAPLLDLHSRNLALGPDLPLAFSPALLLAAFLSLLAASCPRKEVTRGFWLPKGRSTQVGKERSSTA